MKLVTFEEKDLSTIFLKLSINTEKRGAFTVILDDQDQPAKCEGCSCELNTRNLGNIAKGSNKLFCDNPACFASHLALKNY